MNKSLSERILARSVPLSNGCRVWTGPPNRPGGYGVIWATSRNMPAHRAAWVAAHGEVPPGLVIDHICHNRLCVEVGHLRAVTLSENEMNRRGPQINNKSTGVRGVYYQANRFVVAVQARGIQYYGGRFRTLAEAESKAQSMRSELHVIGGRHA